MVVQTTKAAIFGPTSVLADKAMEWSLNYLLGDEISSTMNAVSNSVTAAVHNAEDGDQVQWLVENNGHFNKELEIAKSNPESEQAFNIQSVIKRKHLSDNISLSKDGTDLLSMIALSFAGGKSNYDQLKVANMKAQATESIEAKASIARRIDNVRIDQMELQFNPTNYSKYKSMSSADRKLFLKEYNKQLSRQEAALNDLTVDQFAEARALYKANKRNPAAAKAQADFRAEFEERITQSIYESNIKKNPNMSRIEALQNAETRAAEIKSSLAALHEPDMVMGGYSSHKPTIMGASNVNSSIGGTWKAHVPAVDKMIQQQLALGNGNLKLNFKLTFDGNR